MAPVPTCLAIRVLPSPGSPTNCRCTASRLRAGETVITGTCMVPLPILPGDRVAADYGPLGTISMSFSI